jgi:hypothetical protein
MKQPVSVFVKSIYGQFILHPEVYQQGTGKARGQTEEINKKDAKEAAGISENKQETVSKHKLHFGCCRTRLVPVSATAYTCENRKILRYQNVVLTKNRNRAVHYWAVSGFYQV